MSFCSWTECRFGQWAAYEATREQGGKHLLLPSTTVILFQRWSYVIEQWALSTLCYILWSLILQRIDSCNSVLINLPTSTITIRIPLPGLFLIWIAEHTWRQLWRNFTGYTCTPPYYFRIAIMIHLYSTRTLPHSSAIWYISSKLIWTEVVFHLLLAESAQQWGHELSSATVSFPPRTISIVSNVFLLYLLQNSANSDKIWYAFSCVNLPYSSVNVFILAWIMSTLPCQTWPILIKFNTYYPEYRPICFKAV